jgi:hypothetical protein
MKKHTFKLVLLLTVSASCILSGIDAGKNMPSLRVRSWLSDGIRDRSGQTALECVTLFDVTAPDSLSMLRMLENLQGRFDLPFYGIALNNDKTVQAFFHANKPFTIAFAQDASQRNRTVLANKVSLFPYSILAKEGRVLWTGHPTELENVISQVRSGSFSLPAQRKVESLRRELQMAIQSGLPLVIEQTAQKILAVSKADRIAIQAKLMALNASGRRKEILPFLRKVCTENPGDIQLRVMEMDMMLRQGQGTAFVQAVERFAGELKSGKNNNGMIQAAAYIIENAPYGLLMPSLMLDLAQKAYSFAAGENGKKTLSYAVGCETLARVKAILGDFKEAVRLQKEALAIRKGSRQEAAAAARLRYYEALLLQPGKAR